MISLKRINMSLVSRRKILAILRIRNRQSSRTNWITNELTTVKADFHELNDPELDEILQYLQKHPNTAGLKLNYSFNRRGFTRKTSNLSTQLFDLGYRLFDISVPSDTKIGYLMPIVNYYFIKESSTLEQKLIITA